MATSKKDKKTLKVSDSKAESVKESVKKEATKEKSATVKQNSKEFKTENKIQKPAKKSPKFILKETLLLDGKECIFVEKLKGKVIVRYDDGTFGSAVESEFSVK